MAEPLITIGLTSYNAEATIDAAVRSALQQDWPHFEILIVDDCSTDRTFGLLQAWQQHNSVIRVMRNDSNAGVAVSRNRIIDEATGEFIAFFDDDDESLPNRLLRQYKRIVTYEERFPDIAGVVCHTAREQRYPDGVVRYEATIGTDETARAPAGDDIVKRSLYGKPFRDGQGSCATCSQMARTSLYRAVGKFDPDFRRNQDTDINIRIALAGGHFVGIEEPLVVQTMTLTTDKNLARERACTLALVDKYKDFLLRQKMYDFTVQWFALKFDLMSGDRAAFYRKMACVFLRYPLKTMRKVLWALPNRKFNHQFLKFHRGV